MVSAFGRPFFNIWNTSDLGGPHLVSSMEIQFFHDLENVQLCPPWMPHTWRTSIYSHLECSSFENTHLWPTLKLHTCRTSTSAYPGYPKLKDCPPMAYKIHILSFIVLGGRRTTPYHRAHAHTLFVATAYLKEASDPPSQCPHLCRPLKRVTRKRSLTRSSFVN